MKTLEEVEKNYYDRALADLPLDPEDVRWLVKEAKRLREALVFFCDTTAATATSLLDRSGTPRYERERQLGLARAALEALEGQRGFFSANEPFVVERLKRVLGEFKS